MSGAAPADFGMGAFAEFWSQAAKATLQAQEQAGQMMVQAMRVMPGAAAPTSSAETAGAGQAMAGLWRQAAEMSQTMAATIGAAGKSDGDSLHTLADPRNWMASMGALDGALGKLVEGPQLADLWNDERQQARMARAWLDANRSRMEHGAVVLQAWLRAGQAFTEEYRSRQGTGGKPLDAKAALALWTETANRVLLETQRSDAFLRTQAATIRAGTELQAAQGAMAERWVAAFGLPTRKEMDDVHRTVTELKRELRMLKRQRTEDGA